LKERNEEIFWKCCKLSIEIKKCSGDSVQFISPSFVVIQPVRKMEGPLVTQTSLIQPNYFGNEKEILFHSIKRTHK
jgi:hypothetical protein